MTPQAPSSTVGVMGLGKVGLPYALVAAEAGYQVVGCDIDLDSVEKRLADPPEWEQGLGHLADDAQVRGRLSLTNVPTAMVMAARTIFVVVQTPHEPGYGGETPSSHLERRDFDYSHLHGALAYLDEAALRTGHRPVVAVVSTVLPGTVGAMQERYQYLRLAYAPVLISLGTVIWDLKVPELAIIGADDSQTGDRVASVLGTFSSPYRQRRMSIRSAELLKVSINAYISSEIVFVNGLMELAHPVGADIDEVVDGINQFTGRRLRRPGMGDGGPCRPRDVIALSCLARGVSFYDIFGEIVRAREEQTRHIARIASVRSYQAEMRIVIMGRTYKPGLPLVDGSSAMLLRHYLEEMVPYDLTAWDPEIDGTDSGPTTPAVFVIATPHWRIVQYDFPEGSVVIDPWRLVPDRPGVEVIRLGGSP